jgi:hypothetical protein
MSQKIAQQVKAMLQKRDKEGRPVRGRAMYAYLTGTALGAAQLIFSDAGTRTTDADGTHLRPRTSWSLPPDLPERLMRL